MNLSSALKELPIDFGQANQRATTKGKLIALSEVEDGAGKAALDIGCREGTQSEWLASKGYQATSIDIEKMYADAIVVDANKPLPSKANCFDLIWCSEVIEHLEDPEHFKSEAAFATPAYQMPPEDVHAARIGPDVERAAPEVRAVVSPDGLRQAPLFVQLLQGLDHAGGWNRVIHGDRRLSRLR